METQDEPVIVVDESRLNFIFYVGRRAVELRPIVGDLHWLAVFVLALVGDLAGLGLPLPGTGDLELGQIYVERIADRINLPPRIQTIGLGKLIDNGRARLCSGARGNHTQE